jgi:hypothetical protein
MGEEIVVSIGEEAGWAPEPVWTICRREKCVAPSGDLTSAVQPVTIPTELFWLFLFKTFVITS